MIHEIMEFCIKARSVREGRKSFFHGHRFHRQDFIPVCAKINIFVSFSYGM